ncbi:MAG: hypothetical protein IID39_06430, partial [Planctomycetes bacterium]|nr:hypothetical protein [Planctomycetota bacterium]
LLAVNTPDNRLEVFDITGGTAVLIGAIPVGLDPVSVRARTNGEAWVVNHISDSVSIVDLDTFNVVATLTTLDEPTDVIFAGAPQRAFVSCSQANTVLVFDPNDLSIEPIEVPIDAEDPRGMAVSFDGAEVYVAIFESGNASTILAGGGVSDLFGPNVVNNPAGPYGGVNPPPNDGSDFRPLQNPDNPPPPKVGLIVKKDSNDRWMDDNNGDWTELVSGSLSNLSRRPEGWDLLDRDVAIIDAETLEVRYATKMMNHVMAITVMPVTNLIVVVGTDATNEIRYEPVLNGRFLRVNVAGADPNNPTAPIVLDLNQHLTYTDDIPFEPIPQSERDLSIGDPRGIVWIADGTRAYITGMGSNNVVIIDNGGTRQPPVGDPSSLTIEVGEGPTGLVLDEGRNRLYVLNKFESRVSVIDLETEQVIETVSFFDPSPAAIKIGRKHLYDTHKSSGLGNIACGSCHVDGRMDRLAWDLGNPAGEMKEFNQNCFNGMNDDCADWHPMKGPMLPQTLQDIIGKEPHHWRGDKDGLEEFNGAFSGLLGDDTVLTPDEMQEFEDFVATIFFPPNPFRNFDNSLPTDLPLDGHFSIGRFSPEGTPMPSGNAAAAVEPYRTGNLTSGIDCVTCHTLPTGMGSNLTLVGENFEPFPIGPNGEFHHSLIAGDGSTQSHIKVPQLRNVDARVGFDTTQTLNRAGFGFLHDGSVDSIVRFISLEVFLFDNDQEIADMVAFMLAFSGSDLPMGNDTDPEELLGPTSNDTHAAVGLQITFDRINRNDVQLIALLNEMMTLADDEVVGLVAKGRQLDLQRGYVYVGGDMFQSDRAAETVSATDLRLSADAGSELTFTVVPEGTETRIGVDRDEDTYFDRDELDACSNPADADSIPPNVVISGDYDGDEDVDLFDFEQLGTCITGPDGFAEQTCRCAFDFDLDNDIDFADFAGFQQAFATVP